MTKDPEELRLLRVFLVCMAVSASLWQTLWLLLTEHDTVGQVVDVA